LERGHLHGLYQQFLKSLTSSGVLIGIASKNDPSVVEQAFGRTDLVLRRDDIYPFEVHWSSKSESVSRILETWNVSPEAVVFVDDSPIEVAEVKAAFPEMECLVFPKQDYAAFWRLLRQLRDLFGKSQVTSEDAIRSQSLRGPGPHLAEKMGSLSPDDFLKTLDQAITLEAVSETDQRAFELLNKTNQFNLNGRRFTLGEWQNVLRAPQRVTFSVAYQDKFGPLGKISVVSGELCGRAFRMDAWVMSCRAFSRRIEYQCIKHVFESMLVDEIEFSFQQTSRNAPLQKFFADLIGDPPVPPIRISKQTFAQRVPLLSHRVEGAVHV
jgi:FkbH-like protein